MKKSIKFLLTALLLAGASTADIAANSAIYACGHIRRERTKAIPALKNSGYTTAIIFNVTVENDGTLTTDYDWGNQHPAEAGGIICKDGQYVFGSYQPYFADDVKSLLEAPTSISRLEFCIGGWGNGSYGNIRNLIASQGTGESSILYRNFKALKEAIPEVVAINDDQEQDYDVAAATAFHKMLAEIGYKTTIAPYMQRPFWQQLVANLNADTQIVDLVYLQTYGGGAGNNPNDWKVFGDIPMYVGFDNESSSDIDAMISRFISWRDNTGAAGGFIWNYNNENRNLNQWATAINRIFPPVQMSEDPVVTIFPLTDFMGEGRSLPAGEFSQGQLSLYGIQGKEISSFRLNEGYTVTAYSGEAFSGNRMTFAETTANVNQSWRSKVSSIKIEPVENSVDVIASCETSIVEIFDIQGHKVATAVSPAEFIQTANLPKGIYLAVTPDGVIKIAK